MPKLDLANGYYELPKGKLANIVTCLEMLEDPGATRPNWPAGCTLRKFGPDDLAEFRRLFKKVGQDLMWFSRLTMPDEKLAGILSDLKIESLGLMKDGEAIGILELDFTEPLNCGLSFFGLAPDAVGTGLGKLLMQEAKARAWEKPISRFWVQTCNYDHPRALGFYKVSGFQPYSLKVEVLDDPRLSGHLPLDASPQAALLKP